jgi:ketosteroid isomerase-like protein
MKRIFVIAILVFASSLLVYGQSPAKQKFRNAKAERELKKVEADWADAYVRHDSALLMGILADEFISVGGNGQSHGKQQDIDDLKADSATYDYSTPYDLDVRVYGSMAIVIGRTKEAGHYPSGRQFTNEYRWTDIFVKRHGRWQCVAAQVVSIPPPKSK